MKNLEIFEFKFVAHDWNRTIVEIVIFCSVYLFIFIREASHDMCKYRCQMKLKKTQRKLLDTTQTKQKNKRAAAAARICSNGSKKYEMNQMTTFVSEKKNKTYSIVSYFTDHTVCTVYTHIYDGDDDDDIRNGC